MKNKIKRKVLVSTTPFGQNSHMPFELLESVNLEVVLNPFDRRMTAPELREMIAPFHGLIAGTEMISRDVLDAAVNLEIISRVGIGLDGVDLGYARERSVLVSYTPDAPAPAVADLTLCLMLSLLRHVGVSNLRLHRGDWQRVAGQRLSEVTVGIIGVGRIGSRVLNRISGFGTPRILVNDIKPDFSIDRKFKVEWVSKEQIYEEADIISLHIPLTRLTRNMIGHRELGMMKKTVYLVNTARGGIIDEDALVVALEKEAIGGVALDVFDIEPYSGKLAAFDNAILTPHSGSMSIDCRTRMEVEASEAIASYFSTGEHKRGVPDAEYENQLFSSNR